MLAALGLTLFSGEPALAQGKKKKFDPEIKQVQLELLQALKRVNLALKDEFGGEKGRLDRATIKHLTKARDHIQDAIKEARLAQKADKGGD